MNTIKTGVHPEGGSRFGSWARLPSALVLILVALIIGAGVLLGDTARPDISSLPAERTDTALYEAIITRVSHGENYYAAAAAEQRKRGYPLRPAMTMREPTLSYAAAAVGGVDHLRIARYGIGAAIGLALMVWLAQLSSSRTMWVAATLLTALFAAVTVEPSFVVVHESWTALLMLASLLVRRPGRSALPSVALGFLAMTVREIALPFMFVMAFLAWRERRARETIQWVAATAVFLIGYAIHAVLVLAHTTGADPESQGWFTGGGLPFALSTVREPTVLSSLPFWVVAVVVPLSLLGWASLSGGFATRVFFIVSAFLTIFMVIGRPENWYWGILYAPLIGGGLAFAPFALWTLSTQLWEQNPRKPFGPSVDCR